MASQAWREANPDRARKYRADWYERNKETEKTKVAARTKEYRERNTRIARDAKDRPCTDCGVHYPYYVMHFDHLDAADKDRDIHILVWRPVSEARLRAEIAKCEAVCANCHAERTHQRRLAAGTTEHEGV